MFKSYFTVRGYVYEELSTKAYQYYEEIAQNPDKKPDKAKGIDWKCNHWLTKWFCPKEKIDVCLRNTTIVKNGSKTEITIHTNSTPHTQSSQLELVNLKKNTVFGIETSQNLPKLYKSADTKSNKTNKKQTKPKRKKMQLKIGK